MKLRTLETFLKTIQDSINRHLCICLFFICAQFVFRYCSDDVILLRIGSLAIEEISKLSCALGKTKHFAHRFPLNLHFHRPVCWFRFQTNKKSKIKRKTLKAQKNKNSRSYSLHNSPNNLIKRNTL